MNNAYYPFNTAGKCLFQSFQNNSDTTGPSLFITLKSDYCLSFINCGRKLLTIFAKLSVHGDEEKGSGREKYKTLVRQYFKTLP